MQPIVLKSAQDQSVNFVIPCSDGGFFEARFVQRESDYFIVYLSTFSGCDKSCRFCHLTATGQTGDTAASLDDLKAQAVLVIDYYKEKLNKGLISPASKVHFNFMARGEPLSNPTLVLEAPRVYDELSSLVLELNLDVFFKISSIVPLDFDLKKLEDVFSDPRSMLYYSLYSLDDSFRKRWIPKSINPSEVLSAIESFQQKTGNPIAVHWAFIAGQNDSTESCTSLIQALDLHNIIYKINIVRYNPFGPLQGAESSEDTVFSNFDAMMSKSRASAFTLNHSRVVPRVGFDVKASCGMFIQPTL